MIRLYASASPNVLRVIIALEELALPYQIEIVDIFAGRQFDPEFIALNPNAKVPVIVDPNGLSGKPCTLFESAVILTYLAEKTGHLLSSEPAARYETLQWLTTQVTTVGPMLGQLVHFVSYALPQSSRYAEDRYRDQARRALQVMDRRLTTKRYLADEQFTIADIALFPWTINFARHLGEASEGEFPALIEWRNRISSRPKVKAAMDVQVDIRSRLTPLDKADPATMDYVFSRYR